MRNRVEERSSLCGKLCSRWTDLTVRVGKKKKRPRSDHAGLDVAEAFERVSLPVVWVWTTHFNLSRKVLRVPCGYFEHQRRVQLEGCDARRFKRSAEGVFAPLKLKVFVDDIIALMEGQNKELQGFAEKVQMSMRRRCKRNRFRLSIREGGKEGKSKVISPCIYSEEVSGVQQERRRARK